MVRWARMPFYLLNINHVLIKIIIIAIDPKMENGIPIVKLGKN